MFNRWFLAAVSLVTIAALLLVIYLDSKGPAGPESMAGEVETTHALTDSRERMPKELDPDQRQRAAYVASVLDTLTADRARLPYYGELIRIYTGSARFTEAARWAGERALRTGTYADYVHAAELHVAAMQQKNDEDQIKEEAKKAKEMYIYALGLKSDDPDILTDLAVVYMSLLQPESSYSMLERALKADPEHLRANFNMGVLLHQMGNIAESIPFLDRSLMLADDDPEWETLVRGYLDRHHLELYH
jgi:tetratricopeptide (TPR) repeat protein